MDQVITLVAQKLLARITIALGMGALLGLAGIGIYYGTALFESSAYDVVVVFLLLIIGSNVLAQLAASFIDA